MSSNKRHRPHQGGTTPTTEPKDRPGVAQFSVSEVAQFSMSLDKRQEALALARQKDWALLLCRSGVISLGLLAVWQIPLLFGSISTLDQQNQARSGQLNQRLSQGEQTLRQAPAAAIQRDWQRLRAAGAPAVLDGADFRRAIAARWIHPPMSASVLIDKGQRQRP